MKLTPVPIPPILIASEEYTFEQPAKYLRTGIRVDLSEADYVWTGVDRTGSTATIGAERKKVQEIVTALKGNKRHIEQLYRCKKQYTAVYLIVEGEWREARDGLIEAPHWDAAHRRMEWAPLIPATMWSTIVEHLESIEQALGVVVKKTYDYKETCRTVETLALWWQDAKHSSAINTDGEPFSLVERGLVDRVAAQLPGVGYVLSGRVASLARAPHELDLWGEKEWKKVEGIGPKKATEILKAWHGSSNGTH